MDKFKIDCLVVGGGVAGVSIAKTLAEQFEEIIIVEQNNSLGQEVSSRNSEVIHAGIYYPKESIRSKLCLEGKYLLYEYLHKHNIDFNQCGKFVLSTSEEESNRLIEIKENAEGCGVEDLVLDNKKLKEYPFLSYKDYLYSPSTGIFDSHAFIDSLANEYKELGGLVLFGNKLTKIDRSKDSFKAFIKDLNNNEEFIIETKLIINCAGLGAVNLVNQLEAENKFRLNLIKGEYYNYTGKEKLRHLIYPVPNKDSLGTHATIDLGSGIRFGPSAYRTGVVDYSISNDEKSYFHKSISSYWPGIKIEELSPGYTGIRPLLEDEDDFIIDLKSFDENIFLSILGYSSPGLTSSLALGTYVKGSLRDL